MNYNDQFRSSRHRILNNYNRGAGCSCSRAEKEQQSTTCGCSNTPPETSVSCPITENTALNMRSATHTPACTTYPIQEGCVDSYPVVMAYVPMQKWQELYDPASALHRGTIFRELDLEWYPTNCRKDCRNDKR